MKMSFDEIQSIDDIYRFFINSKRSESHYLEYKKEIKNKPADLTKEVVAFANASGGMIIFGIEEERNHLPKKEHYMELMNKQHIIEDHILTHIQPRFSKTIYRIKSIPNPDNELEGILLVQVEKGDDGPYMNSEKIHYIRREKKSEPMTSQEIRDAIFRSGLFDALILELRDNSQLIEDFLKKIHEIKDKYPETFSDDEHSKNIQAIIFPFKTEAWKAITYSGLLSIIQQNSAQLIELYQSIYQVNQIIDVLKFGHRRIITQEKQSSYYILTVIESTIRQEIKGKLENILKSFTEKEQKI
jgi:hypothetical protein